MIFVAYILFTLWCVYIDFEVGTHGVPIIFHYEFIEFSIFKSHIRNHKLFNF